LRLLVTGGAGFIGSNFIRLILRERPGWQVVNFDLLTYAGNLISLADLEDNPNYSFIRGDISNSADVQKAFEHEIDIVVNFAAETHVDKSLYDPQTFLRSNVLGVAILLEKAMKSSVSRFIQISSDEVYGSIADDKFACETDILNPSSPYAASKASADLLALSFFTTYGFPVLITRSANNYGPYQFPEKLIPFFIVEATKGNHLPLYGNGRNIRNWIHVEDNCRAIMAVLDNGVAGEIYNIGGGNYIDNLSLTKMLLKHLNLSENLIKFVNDRPGHDLRYAVDCTKIGKIGWQPKINFDVGLAATVKWYLSNQDWWRGILSGEHLRFYKDHYKNR
jgi:dTDP-glucose 4,6-dehydratase